MHLKCILAKPTGRVGVRRPTPAADRPVRLFVPAPERPGACATIGSIDDPYPHQNCPSAARLTRRAPAAAAVRLPLARRGLVRCGHPQHGTETRDRPLRRT